MAYSCSRMAVIHYVELVPLRGSVNTCGDSSDYACRLSLRGSLSVDSAQETGILIQALVDGGLKRLILNLENVTYVDSSGIGLIIRIKKALDEARGDVVLYNVPPKVNDVFELVNLKEFVPVFYDEKKALEYLRGIS